MWVYVGVQTFMVIFWNKLQQACMCGSERQKGKDFDKWSAQADTYDTCAFETKAKSCIHITYQTLQG